MGSIADKLTYLNNTKSAIKDALIAKGQQVSASDTFRSYAEKVRNISGGGGTIVSKSITQNGTYYASSDHADGYNPVTVSVPEPVLLSKIIVQNGTYRASDENADGYSQVTVNIPKAYASGASTVITNSNLMPVNVQTSGSEVVA